MAPLPTTSATSTSAPVPFGKYRGSTPSAVSLDAGYCTWVTKNVSSKSPLYPTKQALCYSRDRRLRSLTFLKNGEGRELEWMGLFGHLFLCPEEDVEKWSDLVEI